MKKHLIYWLAAFVVLAIGCQKELSFEGSNTPAKGSLRADVTGDCLPKTVNGTYVAGTALVPATNTITVQVNVTKTGTYTVSTDTTNGFYFRGTGTFTTLGVNSVTLRGNGIPASATNSPYNFVVNFDTIFCDIQIPVLPAGSGPAVFTLVSGGTPTNCASADVKGTYVKNAVLNATNYVDITVNVATIGTYTIRATGGGMVFLANGTFSSTGNKTVRLFATGSTATTVGANTIRFDAPFASCNFVVTVVAPVTGTLGGGPGACLPITVNGNYTLGVPLPAGNTVQVQITTASVGPYFVTTDTQAGIKFSASGTSNGATQLITLLNNGGTPLASGPQNFTVTFGASTCTFSVNVGTAGAYTPDCSTANVNGIYKAGTVLNASNTVDININVTSLGPFSISTAPVNGDMVFSLSGTFSTPGVQTITLQGSGTPAVQGGFDITMPGTTTCTFHIICVGINWSLMVGGTTTYQGSTLTAVLTPNSPAPGFTSFDYVGDNVATDYFVMQLIDLAGGINANEDYDTRSQGTSNVGWTFSFTAGNNSVDLYADPVDTSVGIIFHVSSHNTSTRTIIGTFQGTAFDFVSGTIKNVSNGTFNINY